MRPLLLAIFLIPFFANAQTVTNVLPLDSATQKYTYTEVVKVDSASADALYSRAKVALAKLFVSGKDVSQVNDDNAKQVVGKGFTECITSDGMMKRNFGKIWFVLTIQCKDGRYKYTITDFEQESTAWPYTLGALEQEKVKLITKNTWNRIRSYTADQMTTLIADLKKIMSNAANSNSSNW